MGGLSILRGLVGGLDQAAGNPDGAEQMQTLNQRDRTNKIAALRSQILPHSLAIQGLQTKLSALDPEKDADAYNSTVNDMQDHTHAIRDILYPDAKLGLSDWLQTHTTDRLHITSHDQRMRDLAAQNAQADAKGEGQDAATAAALAQGVVPYEQTPGALLEKQKAQATLDAANARAKAMGLGTRPVPYYAGAINKDQALDTAKAGKVYRDGNGDEIDVTKIPDGMFLLPVFAGGGKEYYELGTDKGRYETGNNQRQFQPAVGGPVANPQTIGAARVPTTSSSSSTDSMGVTTNTSRVSSPVTPGGATSPQSASPAPAGPKTQKLRSAQAGTPTSAQPAASGAALALDADGHIPATDGSNAQLRQAANRLLDGADPKDLQIPARDKGPAQELAGRYGWQQGQFTPREQTQIRVATNFLQQLQSSPSLAVLDSIVSREKIRHALDPKGGFVSDVMAKNLTPAEAEFVRNYNAAVGTVQGLSSITRANRPVEAGVRRLMAELPNVIQSQGSADAKARIDQLLKEVAISQQSPNRPHGAKTRALTQTKSLADRLDEALP